MRDVVFELFGILCGKRCGGCFPSSRKIFLSLGRVLCIQCPLKSPNEVSYKGILVAAGAYDFYEFCLFEKCKGPAQTSFCIPPPNTFMNTNVHGKILYSFLVCVIKIKKKVLCKGNIHARGEYENAQINYFTRGLT